MLRHSLAWCGDKKETRREIISFSYFQDIMFYVKIKCECEFSGGDCPCDAIYIGVNEQQCDARERSTGIPNVSSTAPSWTQDEIYLLLCQFHPLVSNALIYVTSKCQCWGEREVSKDARGHFAIHLVFKSFENIEFRSWTYEIRISIIDCVKFSSIKFLNFGIRNP